MTKFMDKIFSVCVNAGDNYDKIDWGKKKKKRKCRKQIK